MSLKTIAECKKLGIDLLSDFSPSPALDVSCFLRFILNCDNTYLLLHHKDFLSPEQEVQYFSFLENRKTGRPVAYITGKKEFYGFDFAVSPDVLIPKPDTEILVEHAISAISKTKKEKIRVCDMCTGSGCIGISVAKNTPEKIEFTLADISRDALQIAKKNAATIAPEKNIKFLESNLFQNFNAQDKFDFILTNPPYIPSNLVEKLLCDGRSEPRLALDGDVNPASNSSEKNDGLGIIRNLIPEMKKHMNQGGIFFMETGEYNAEEASKIAEENGFCEIEILKDLEGQLRVVKGSLL